MNLCLVYIWQRINIQSMQTTPKFTQKKKIGLRPEKSVLKEEEKMAKKKNLKLCPQQLGKCKPKQLWEFILPHSEWKERRTTKNEYSSIYKEMDNPHSLLIWLHTGPDTLKNGVKKIKKLKINLLRDLDIPLLDIYPKVWISFSIDCYPGMFNIYLQ